VIILAVLGLRNLVRFTPHRIIAVLLAFYIGWFFLPPAFKERVLTFTQYAHSESVQNRIGLQEAAWDIWLEHPIWGVGLGGYGPLLLEDNSRVARTMQWFADQYDWPPQYIGTHNMYLQLMCETGLVGLFIFLIFLGYLMRDLRAANARFNEEGDYEGAALTSTLEVALIAFIFSAFLLHALQQKIWWIVAATAAVLPLNWITAARRGERPAPGLRPEPRTLPPAADSPEPPEKNGGPPEVIHL
jgi:O-antigen ligase